MSDTTVYDVFVARAATRGECPLLAVPRRNDRDYYPEGVEFSYAQVEREVHALADRYEQAGYGHGHRVALLLENRPEYFMHMLALNREGVSVVPINPDYHLDEVRYLLDHSDAELVVSVRRRVADMERASEASSGRPPVVDADALPDALPAAASVPRKDAPNRGTEAALLYTSGTTGRPKGCILSNEYHFRLGGSYLGFGGMASIDPGKDRLYNPLPLFHMNASILSFMCMMLSGGCLIVPDRFHPSSWWQDVTSTRATIIHYLGIVPPLLLNQPVSAIERRHQIRFGLGAGVEPQLHEAFEQRFGFPLIEIWGMTETGGGFAASTEPREIRTRAFGRPRADIEAGVVDENDNEIARGTPGELVVRRAGADPRHGFFSGYLKNKEATRGAWRNDWFHTGDIVSQDDSGMLYFIDRKKNIVRRAGENIAAAEVEATLQAHDQVAQVAVIAAPDELREEEVLACIVAAPDALVGNELARKLFDWCLVRLAYFKAPGWIVFMDAIPTTATQKVRKSKIFEPGEDPRTFPGAIDLRSYKKR